MTTHLVQIEKWQGTNMAFLRVRNADAPETDKDVLRPLDHLIFEGTAVPAEHRVRAGALASLMMHYPKRNVLIVELRAFRDGDLWTAEAQISESDQIVYRRGVGANPLDALTALAVDVQEY